MVIELTTISTVPVKEEAKSILKYVPQTVYQKRIFVVENIQLEEYTNSQGKSNNKYCFIKSDNEYYKINSPYEEMKNKYFKNLEILGLNAKRSNYTNI